MKSGGGYFVVSLDFELFWGMFDKHTIQSYGARIEGERTAIPRTLDLFNTYHIHATWATVGMLMARDKKELCSLIPPPHLQPHYTDVRMSAYHYLNHTRIGNDETDDPYHYGTTLVHAIARTPFQEIGNHTFSHFYCMDGEHNEPSIFEADLDAHARIAKTYDVHTTALVFPRNQASDQAVRTSYKKGIRVYRGNETHVWYRGRKDEAQSLFIRAFRLIDHYINLSGYHTYPLTTPVAGVAYTLPSSRFLRPWSKTLCFLEWLKVKRITRAMTYAAKKGEVFHLWWHPHNMGVDQVENFSNLKKIIDHFVALKHAYGMESLTMTEAYERALERAR